MHRWTDKGKKGKEKYKGSRLMVFEHMTGSTRRFLCASSGTRLSTREDCKQCFFLRLCSLPYTGSCLPFCAFCRRPLSRPLASGFYKPMCPFLSSLMICIPIPDLWVFLLTFLFPLLSFSQGLDRQLYEHPARRSTRVHKKQLFGISRPSAHSVQQCALDSRRRRRREWGCENGGLKLGQGGRKFFFLID